MPIQSLPDNPSLENLRKQAKTLAKAARAAEPGSHERVREFHPHANDIIRHFNLSDAQLVIARSYGFKSWSRLKRHLEMLKEHSLLPKELASADDNEPLPDRFVRLACLNYNDDDVRFRTEARTLLADHPLLAGENIYTAATVGDIAALKAMLKTRPALARRRGGPYHWEPLLYVAYSRLNSEAAGHSTLEAARILLETGGDPNAGYLWDGRYVFTALTGAFGEGERGPVHQSEHQYCYALARLLLEAGADPNDSQTLYNRMFSGGIRHLELLFEFGLGKDGHGVWFKRLGSQLGTPAEMLQQQICWAAKYNQMERLRLLLAHGVDVNLPDTRLHHTPSELAILNGNAEIAQYLLVHGARKPVFSDTDAFAAACIGADRKTALALLAKNPALIQQLGPDRVELLQRAAESGKPDAIRLMAELHFDLNEVKRTAALHHAAMAGDLQMTKLLIELGADPHIRDTAFNGRPIGWARYGNKSEVIAFLEQFEDK